MRSVTNHCETRLESRPRDLFRGSPAKSKRRPPVVCAVMDGNAAGAAKEHAQGSKIGAPHIQNGGGPPVVGGENVPLKRPRLSTNGNGHGLTGSSTTPNSVAESRIGGGAAATSPSPTSTPVQTPNIPRHAGLEDLADKYTLGRILGEGTYG